MWLARGFGHTSNCYCHWDSSRFRTTTLGPTTTTGHHPSPAVLGWHSAIEIDSMGQVLTSIGGSGNLLGSTVQLWPGIGLALLPAGWDCHEKPSSPGFGEEPLIGARGACNDFLGRSSSIFNFDQKNRIVSSRFELFTQKSEFCWPSTMVGVFVIGLQFDVSTSTLVHRRLHKTRNCNLIGFAPYPHVNSIGPVWFRKKRQS